MATAYFPALIWLISAVICYLIAKRRHVKLTFAAIIVALLGPFAIPLMFFMKSEQAVSPAPSGLE